MFVKYKERVFNFAVLVDVVPGVNGQNSCYCLLWCSADGEVGKLPEPVGGVPLLGCGDDVNVSWSFLCDVVSSGREALADSDVSEKYLPRVKFINCFLLVWVKFHPYSTSLGLPQVPGAHEDTPGT